MFEIEYKYQVDNAAGVQYLDDVANNRIQHDKLVSISNMEQFYVVDDSNVALRVRIENKGTDSETRTLAIKGANSGISRLEIERELSKEEVVELRKLAISHLEKTRYKIDVGGWLWEFDVFLGKLAGKIYAEIEVNHENDDFNMPACDGMTMVDGREHSNAYLASLTVA